MKKTIILEICCALLIILWAYAAFSKLFIYEAFRFQLLGHKLLADHAALIAWLVPAIEIVIALLLLLPQTRQIGLASSVVLLAVFTAYIVYMFNFYPHKPCSCGGIISKLGWREHIVFNLFFLVLAVIALRLNKKKRPDNQQKMLTAAMA